MDGLGDDADEETPALAARERRGLGQQGEVGAGDPGLVGAQVFEAGGGSPLDGMGRRGVSSHSLSTTPSSGA